MVKVGTSTLSRSSGRVDPAYISSLTGQIAALTRKGHKVILVTSGAIGAGIEALGLPARPKDIGSLQACAAIGQGRIMKHYQQSFRRRGIHAAQILLTRDDFADRKRFLNAKNTMLTLMYRMGAVPVINENDTIATEEIKFGDNDRLSAMVASLVSASTLVLLTDVDGLYSPEDKKVIPIVAKINAEIERMVRPAKGRWGVGGMASKLAAARIAMRGGTTCIIANGGVPRILLKIAGNEPVGTTFMAAKVRQKAKKSWLAFAPKPRGVIIVDAGARNAIEDRKTSLLAAGIRGAKGYFLPGDVVDIAGPGGVPFARGMAAYSSDDIGRIKGRKSAEVARMFGRERVCDEVVHRDNMVLLR